MPPRAITPRVGWPSCLAVAIGKRPVVRRRSPHRAPSRPSSGRRAARTPLLCSVASERKKTTG
uniref:Uncharacterized protein n=1 Tax=Oryza punctata TaxID=4537 RepID=A0A0E0LUK8_ORYPU